MRYLLHDVFIDNIQQYSHRIAVREEFGRTISYSELNQLSNQFANFLLKLKKSIRTSPYVGILSYVHINSIAAILGALKIGCAYIPLDESSPYERLKHIIDNTKLDVLIVDPVLSKRHERLIQEAGIPYIVFTDDVRIQESSHEEIDLLNQVSDDLAYILHSSGSTGVSKGIMLTHRNARTFVDWMHKEFKVTENDIIMSRAPFKFDLSVFDIFNTFKAGATLICYDWRVQRDPDQKHQHYVSLMKKEKATVLYTTPSTFISLMNRGNLENTSLFLRCIMYAGEPFPIPQLKKLKAMLSKDCQIANIYGPTETNIITYHWIDKIPEDESPIPLGKVVDDTEILVVSEDRTRLCEANEIGELWCRGGTVTLGYLSLKEKTEENLVLSPFHPYPATFWRTGDFGFKDKMGLLHYRGRRDHMIKIKGYRIELGEIESALAKQASIDEFCVIVKENGMHEKSLHCFYSTLTGKPIKTELWKEFLLKFLPSYMVPETFTYLLRLPKTSSEKIDRIKLAESLHECV